METVLAIYERPLQANRARLCFDERPCQLLDDVVVALPMKPDVPAKEDNDRVAGAICQKRNGGGLAGV